MDFKPVYMPFGDDEFPESIQKRIKEIRALIEVLDRDRAALNADQFTLSNTPAEECGPRLKDDLDSIETRALELLQREMSIRTTIIEFATGEYNMALRTLADDVQARPSVIANEVREKILELGFEVGDVSKGIPEPLLKTFISFYTPLRRAKSRSKEIGDKFHQCGEFIRLQDQLKDEARIRVESIVSKYKRSIV